jgi:DNA (cytosine-5)-methyltransferase 1
MYLNILSLFCGLGGFDLGALGGFAHMGRRYVRLPTRIALAVDNDPVACAIYGQNIGPVRCADVREIEQWPDADLIIGGPPCQPYSAAGNRSGKEDPRDLIPEFAQVVEQVLPKSFVMENVAALAGARHRATFARLCERFEDAGYLVEGRVLEAADFGVPQTRRRLFLQGVRSDLRLPMTWPTPTHDEKGADGLCPWVTCRAAIADLEFAAHALSIRELAEGERRYPSFGAGARRQIADRPLFTITAQGVRGKKMYHPWYDRPLTLAELKRGMGFGDDFVVWKPAQALGNAVPPPLAHAVVRQICETLLSKNQ